MSYRFKTKEEFENEKGSDWRSKLGYYWNFKMDEYFGKPYIDLNKYSFNISRDMLISSIKPGDKITEPNFSKKYDDLIANQQIEIKKLIVEINNLKDKNKEITEKFNNYISKTLNPNLNKVLESNRNLGIRINNSNESLNRISSNVTTNRQKIDRLERSFEKLPINSGVKEITSKNSKSTIINELNEPLNILL